MRFVPPRCADYPNCPCGWFGWINCQPPALQRWTHRRSAAVMLAASLALWFVTIGAAVECWPDPCRLEIRP